MAIGFEKILIAPRSPWQNPFVARLIASAFPRRAEDRALAILADVPDAQVPDNDDWCERRWTAQRWARALRTVAGELGLQVVTLAWYPNVQSNNADLPAVAWDWDGDPGRIEAAGLAAQGRAIPMEEILAAHQLILAPTDFSTIAPLKLKARQHRFRAATMPGFSAAMIPALRLDYGEIDRRVQSLKRRLDRAAAIEIKFVADGATHRLHLDVRHRTAHASSGLFPEPGIAGNLPSGEAYFVPYEGEKGEPSQTAGMLQVQLGDEVVVYRVEANRAVAVESRGPLSAAEAEKILVEPAYANVAEAGFGVLADMGIRPIGELLLEEKLGLHIAFGRSDHFGGTIGVADFSSPGAVIHIDRIYIPEVQPRVAVPFVDLVYEDGARERLMENGRYRTRA